MNVKILLLVATTCILSSCSTFNYTDHVFFKSFIGKKIPLQEDVIVCSSDYHSEFKLEKIYIESRFVEYHDGISERTCVRDTFITTLPKGHLIELKAVYKKVLRGIITTSAYVAVGKFTLPNGETVKFQYDLGGMGEIYRAPWEDKSVKSPRKM